MSIPANQLPLEQRLMEQARLWLTTPISGTIDPAGYYEGLRQQLVTLAFRRRDEDTAITPETDPAKAPRIICQAADLGRTRPYANLRNLSLTFTVRANAAVPQGQADPFHAITGALESLLDGFQASVPNVTPATTYLNQALSSTTWQIATLLSTRESSTAHKITGKDQDIREVTYPLKIRAIGLEHTAD